MTEPNHQGASSFLWVSLLVFTTFGIILLWMIADFKRKMVSAVDDVQSTVAKVQLAAEEVDAKIPGIMQEVQQTSHTLSRVAEDVELMKRVAGVDNESNQRGFRGLAVYADDLQQFLATEVEGKSTSMLCEHVIETKLAVTESAEEFLVGLNREMVLAILPLAKSREEILYRVCHSSVRRVPFYIQFEWAEPVLLEDFIRENHAASQDLPAFK